MQVLAAYEKWLAVNDKVQREGRASTEDVSGYMTDKQKLEWQKTGLNHEKDDSKLVGEVTHTSAVTAVDLAATPPQATVTTCLDARAATLVDSKTGEQKKIKQQEQRYVQIATIIQEQGVWKVDRIQAQRQQAC